VDAYLEVWRPDGRALVPLDSDRATVGKAESSDIVLDFDSKVSRLHAVLERLSGQWCVRDLSSSNGTFVNGERIWAERPLRHGDELRFGLTKMLFRAEAPTTDRTKTEVESRPPDLTVRERDVLVELCRPVLSGDVFTEPASIREVAEALVVTEGAVKQHLANLYDKFGIHDDTGRKRVRLANEAVRRGAVSVSDLRS
jgi:hypothetical protein